MKMSENLRRDLDTLKTLDARQKLQFLWDYYKWYVISIVCILFIVGTFVHILWEGQKPCRLRVCVVLNTEDDCGSWFREFAKNLKADGKPGDVDVNQDQPFDYDNRYSYLHEIEVMTTISSQRMDVAVCGADMYRYLLALNACLPLDTALSDDLLSYLSAREMLCYDTANLTEDENGNIDLTDGIDGYFAVDLAGTKFYEAYNQTEESGKPLEEPLYAVIISNTEHLEDCETLLRALVTP
ncbi:MAG: hypothetical protein HDR19_07635 [Lachnospiraceae bacterium]|nr:hypothetical protein [Lachnospiraceae bacterium]